MSPLARKSRQWTWGWRRNSAAPGGQTGCGAPSSPPAIDSPTPARIMIERTTPARPLVFAAATLLILSTFAPRAVAQARPTPGQAQALLQTRPDLVARLEAQLKASGLSNDQIRARLRAEGYPESLLDAYLPGGK